MKINDRIVLGIVSGLTGNMVKMAVMTFAKNMNWSEITCREKAAGMLIPAHQAYSSKGRMVGHVADNVVAVMLGVGTVYMLSITGKDKAWLKGLAAGKAMWVGIYGVLSTMGATRTDPLSAKTVLSEFVGHSVFGLTAAMTSVYLGAPALFSGEKPLSASPVSNWTRRRSREKYRTTPESCEVRENERITH